LYNADEESRTTFPALSQSRENLAYRIPQNNSLSTGIVTHPHVIIMYTKIEGLPKERNNGSL
jgi:hypothetical protein